MRNIQPSCSLYAIIARDGRSAAVLRRGPSKQVQLIRWWLGSDTFEEGQWFKGRIYERRCDLSPSGERFVYFAQDFGRSPGSWTAVSKPPYLTALVLWAKGDCWGGGGLFDSEMTLRLNHRPGAESKAEDTFGLPKKFKVRLLGDHSGWGEDDPINHYRLIRDGWRHVQQGRSKRSSEKAEISYPFDPSDIYARAHPGVLRVDLFQITLGIGVKNGPWYKQDYAVLPRHQKTAFGRLEPSEFERQAELYLADCSWADWAPNGDLLYATGGQLFRLRCSASKPSGQLSDAPVTLLSDWNESRFRPLGPTAEAQRW
ncbi:MAG: hypothetical protein ACR2OV_06885 [Hyphomicrobiaceae bacterium]